MNAAAVSPDPQAQELSEQMVANDETMRTIIEETITSAQNGAIKEAGRTVCPGSGSIKGPLGRFRRSIDLASCPVSRGGTYHTHVSPRELREPVNSLPDMANVVYGLIDVSVVAGTRSADVITAAEDQVAMVNVFENAIGERFGGPRELFRAIKDGRVMPSTARQRAREALAPLVSTAQTGYDDLEAEIETVPAKNWAPPAMSGRGEAFAGQAAPAYFAPDSVDAAASKMDDVVEGFDLSGLVISTTVGTLVGGAIERLIWGN